MPAASAGSAPPAWAPGSADPNRPELTRDRRRLTGPIAHGHGFQPTCRTAGECSPSVRNVFSLRSRTTEQPMFNLRLGELTGEVTAMRVNKRFQRFAVAGLASATVFTVASTATIQAAAP